VLVTSLSNGDFSPPMQFHRNLFLFRKSPLFPRGWILVPRAILVSATGVLLNKGTPNLGLRSYALSCLTPLVFRSVLNPFSGFLSLVWSCFFEGPPPFEVLFLSLGFVVPTLSICRTPVLTPRTAFPRRSCTQFDEYIRALPSRNCRQQHLKSHFSLPNYGFF